MENKQLFEALVKAQNEMPALPFDANNPYYHSRYTTLGKIIELTKPILAKYELAITQQIISGHSLVVENTEGGENTIAGEVGIRTILFHSSGESIYSECIIPVSGKNIAQEAGKTITYLRRYAWASILGLYSDEDIDANSSEQQGGQRATRKAPEPTTPVTPSNREPLSPKELVEALKSKAKISDNGNEKTMQMVAGWLTKLAKDKRHEVQKYLFGTESLKDVSPKLWSAAWAWLSPFQNESGEWVVSKAVKTEVESVIGELNAK